VQIPESGCDSIGIDVAWRKCPAAQLPEELLKSIAKRLRPGVGISKVFKDIDTLNDLAKWANV